MHYDNTASPRVVEVTFKDFADGNGNYTPNDAGYKYAENADHSGSFEFVTKAENIVFIGPTGVGKTGLASALLLKALQNGYRGVFMRAQDLFDEMYASIADRSTRRLLNRLASVDLVVIDEMGYLNWRLEQSNI